MLRKSTMVISIGLILLVAISLFVFSPFTDSASGEPRERATDGSSIRAEAIFKAQAELRNAQAERERVSTFAKAYQKHLDKVWIDSTNFKAWIDNSVKHDQEVAAAKAAAAKTAAAKANTTTQATHQTPAAAHYGSGACGGDLPPCYVMRRESGGSLTAQNPTSTASGKWQFLRSTWAGFGGYSEAWMAPESVQDAKARILWDGGRGCSHWSAC
jgi:hypothetical protein